MLLFAKSKHEDLTQIAKDLAAGNKQVWQPISRMRYCAWAPKDPCNSRHTRQPSRIITSRIPRSDSNQNQDSTEIKMGCDGRSNLRKEEQQQKVKPHLNSQRVSIRSQHYRKTRQVSKYDRIF